MVVAVMVVAASGGASVVVVFVMVVVMVDVGHRAVFFCRFWKPHYAGEVLPNFLIEPVCFFFAEKSSLEPSRSTSATPIVFFAAAGLPTPRCLAIAPTRHGPASLTPPPP
jgi:hypothetical protein